MTVQRIVHLSLFHFLCLFPESQCNEKFGMTAPNYGLYINVTVYVHAVSEPRPRTMDFDADITVVLETNLNEATCRKYFELMVPALNMNPPKPKTLSYLASNNPSNDPEIASRFWFPEIFFKEATKMKYASDVTPTFCTEYRNTAKNSQIDNKRNCSTQYALKRLMTIACNLEFNNFPLDTQICYLTASSFTYAEDSMFMTWKDTAAESLKVNPNLHLNEFTIQVTSATMEHMSIDDHRLTGVAIKFVFTRKLTYQLVCTIIPSCLLVIASFGVYLMAPQAATERIALSINTLLALITMYTQTRAYVPASGSFTYADMWMTACLLFVLMVTMECCMVEMLSSSEAEFEERRKRRETDLRKKEDLFRYVQEFKDRMPSRIKTAAFGPAVMGAPLGVRRPPSVIIRRYKRRATQGDLDVAFKALLTYVNKVTPWFLLPWDTRRVDTWAKRVFVGGFFVFTISFWTLICVRKFVFSS